MAFKIAYDAGHFKHTLGNRLPEELDRSTTSEWELNDRIARYFAQAAKQYEGVELLRVDDVTGKTDVGLAQRCKLANDFGADFYLSIHHNAGANLTSAGGIVAYSHIGSEKGAAYRDAIYKACIAAGGLRGNRAEPVQEGTFYVLRNTAMPAVLMEYGFMDSAADAPVILQEQYAEKMAFATMEAIAAVAGFEKKNTVSVELPFLKQGAVNGYVQAMQRLLTGWGYPLDTDGIFGGATAAAVKGFQSAYGLAVDGICGRNTWQKLLEME